VLDSLLLTVGDHWFFVLCMRASLFPDTDVMGRLAANTLTPEELCYRGAMTPFSWTVYKR
jgi:hypothetical protein